MDSNKENAAMIIFSNCVDAEAACDLRNITIHGFKIKVEEVHDYKVPHHPEKSTYYRRAQSKREKHQQPFKTPLGYLLISNLPRDASLDLGALSQQLENYGNLKNLVVD